ncbi:glycosyltransferase [Verrucomicrobium sp. BvORR106]|uniref:glycosyltransferase n=1 Tax=Verrucomicrobium sp. BvORR106 TaxID=1403819 RepID=UPI00068CB56E|nr:glycosyltransferase [Verrucomicrobium sp. BvORR106]
MHDKDSKSPWRKIAQLVRRPFGKSHSKEGELRQRLKALAAEKAKLQSKAAKFRSQRDDLRHTLTIQQQQHVASLSARPGHEGYARWVAQFDTLGESDWFAMRAHIKLFPRRPLISIIMPVWNVAEPWLRRAIESAREQIYPHWELCIADDGSTKPHIRKVLEEYQALDSRIKVVFREKCGHISAAANSAIELATGEFVAFLDHDDELTRHALYLFALEIINHPDADLIYSDEDKIDEHGFRFEPYFKSEFNRELLTAQNCICHLAAFRTSLVRQIGGFRLGTEGAQDWDLTFRLIEATSPDRIRHIPHILYHWRIIPGSTASGPDEKPYAIENAKRVVLEHLERTGGSGAKIEVLPIHMFRITHPLPDPAPSVTLIIPTRNLGTLLQICVDTITSVTDYPNFEVLVIDNESTEPEVLNYLDEISKRPCVRVLKSPGPFNYSKLNNLGVASCDSQVVALLNNDLEILHPGWLWEMVSHAIRPGVGAVGAKLIFPNGLIQHAGVFLGARGVAAHYYRHCPGDYLGIGCRAHVVNNVSAVTGACLVVERSKYLEVAGLDDVNLPIAFNDVDFCLKLLSAGYRNVYTPFAKVKHHESASRGYTFKSADDVTRGRGELRHFSQKWAALIENDPAYNPNLTIDDETGSFAFPPRTHKPWRHLPGGRSLPQQLGKSTGAPPVDTDSGNFIPLPGASKSSQANGSPTSGSMMWALSSPSAMESLSSSPTTVLFEGWAVSTSGNKVTVSVSVSDGVTCNFLPTVIRPDVADFLEGTYKLEDMTCGFRHQVPLPNNGQALLTVMLTFSDGNSTSPELVYKIRRPVAPFSKSDDAFKNLHFNRGAAGMQFLKGTGIEYGALTTPHPVPAGVQLRYADQASTDELLAKYGSDPMLAGRDFVKVDFVVDVQTFQPVEDESQDFLIVHDVIEHLENPLLAVQNWFRVVKPEGILIISAPDKRYTFDYSRPLTPLAHLERDYSAGPETSRRDAYLEWHQHVSKHPEPEKAADQSVLDCDDIHFHVWTQSEILELFVALKRRGDIGFEILFALENEGEMLMVFKKTKVVVYDRANPSTMPLLAEPASTAAPSE